ncbi:hypothetical protein QT970_17380 [Microcoleus sp. herbarium8]|uniref:hypothetical protein n=1 Tax=Microcoleus sp. herbarium8 TaxID=3055436 RepID=UPI002FD64568
MKRKESPCVYAGEYFNQYRFGRSSNSTFVDRRNGQSGALYLSNRKIVSHPKNTRIVSQKACKKPAKNLPHKDDRRSIIKIATLGTFDLDKPLNCSLVSQTFTVKKKAGRWLVSFCDAESLPFPQPQKSVGSY